MMRSATLVSFAIALIVCLLCQSTFARSIYAFEQIDAPAYPSRSLHRVRYVPQPAVYVLDPNELPQIPEDFNEIAPISPNPRVPPVVEETDPEAASSRRISKRRLVVRVPFAQSPDNTQLHRMYKALFSKEKKTSIL
uniref:DUF4794 domain-containing protein n=1 Tax=Panagrellus redivivus TaxID=6233 RepID=A0A7E4W0V5_PANRE